MCCGAPGSSYRNAGPFAMSIVARIAMVGMNQDSHYPFRSDAWRRTFNLLEYSRKAAMDCSESSSGGSFCSSKWP